MVRGQFKIQQMAFMLLALFLFFMFVSLFWLSLEYRNLQEKASELEQSKTAVASRFISQSTEFSCAKESYCINTDKLMILKDKKEYKDFWPVAFIEVRKLDRKQEKECTKENYPNCNIYKVYKNKNINEGISEGSFVALCRYEQESGYVNKVCEIGKIIIGY